MEHIKSPDRTTYTKNNHYVFIGGGITGCPNWQKEMVERFKDVENIVLFNPRRDDFDVRDPSVNDQQLQWEHDHIFASDAVLFWFPFEGRCIITMYELGMCAALGKKMFVATHPGYERRYDVVTQMKMIRPEIVVHDNFQDVVDEVIKWHNA